MKKFVEKTVYIVSDLISKQENHSEPMLKSRILRINTWYEVILKISLKKLA